MNANLAVRPSQHSSAFSVHSFMSVRVSYQHHHLRSSRFSNLKTEHLVKRRISQQPIPETGSRHPKGRSRPRHPQQSKSTPSNQNPASAIKIQPQLSKSSPSNRRSTPKERLLELAAAVSIADGVALAVGAFVALGALNGRRRREKKRRGSVGV